jgi:hypothetical protein
MGLFGPPKITLKLDKFSFNPGEVVNGSVTLNLKKPTYARKLEVSLIGVRRVNQIQRHGSKTSWQTVYSFEIPVSGEKEYQSETIPFQLPIAPDILSAKSGQQAVQEGLENKLGAAGSLISAVAVGAGQTKWKIRAQLDIPKAFDVKIDQDIQLFAAQNQQGGAI